MIPTDDRLRQKSADDLLARWAVIILICGVVVIVLTTILPFDFDLGGDISLYERIFSRFDLRLIKQDARTDLPRNVLLFIPFGFGLSCLLHRYKQNNVTTIVATLAASIALSLIVELIQVWLPSRSPSVSDIVANSLGVLLGLSSFYFLRAILANMLIAGLIIYIIFIFLVTIYLQSGVKLSHWDPSFPLILGNELTGDRPWSGYITEVTFTNHVLTPEQIFDDLSIEDRNDILGDTLIASYQFTGNDPYIDQTGNLPSLIQQGNVINEQSEIGVLVGPDFWLMTTSPVIKLSEKVSQTSELSIITTVATADLTQDGPARIISISTDPFQRNLTLGQSGKDLIVRLRTPITGENGINPSVAIPNVFRDVSLHRLVITYEPAILRVYVDENIKPFEVALTPEVTFSNYLFGYPLWHLSPGSISARTYTFLYYGILFFPIGVLTALIRIKANWNNKINSWLIVAIIIIPPMVLELLLINSRGLRLQNLLLSIALSAGVIILSEYWVSRNLQN